ncbi:TFIIB-type zinc ribbon-containing protein [Thiosulfatihalobacter marinus]|uniref:TFIIB-type zinc ribbon-containing protein n=1 Tax=Thiosulfatihalobacter marinus TaxID=2792481 RepID=UPI0018D87469|nr:zf-TFIIB domain-containing protein [Thiosulfatihalobacter marinus]
MNSWARWGRRETHASQYLQTLCPRCNVTRSMSNWREIVIVDCPQCRGAWPDRGDLDKINERSAVDAALPECGPRPAQPA